MKSLRGTFLLLTAALILFACAAQPVTQSRSIGMGDVHVYENQNLIPVTGLQKSYVGMGDLHRYESQAMIPVTGKSPSVGMGDLHFFESQQ